MEAEQEKSHMTSPARLTRGARKVALRLSGVSEADRQWVLAQLEPASRSLVEKAYLDLKRVTGDAPLDFGLFFGSEAATDSSLTADTRLNQLPFTAIQAVLLRLPAEYVAAIIRSGLWSEAGRYLQECDKKRRQELLAVAGSRVTPSAATALMDAVAAHVQSELHDDG